eukprot:5492221-Pyramimonas_sp.AAC.1
MRRGSRHPETLQNKPDAAPDRFQRQGVKSQHHAIAVSHHERPPDLGGDRREGTRRRGEIGYRGTSSGKV